MSLRRPVWALHVLIVGLALHNLVMSQLWRAGVRGGALSVVAAWKDVLLARRARCVVLAQARAPPFRLDPSSTGLRSRSPRSSSSTRVLPQSLLGGGATHKGVLYARAARPAARSRRTSSAAASR